MSKKTGRKVTKEVVTFSLLLCVVGLIKRVPFSAFLLTSATVAESDSGSDMEGYGGLEEEARETTLLCGLWQM
jgi:hypothetical protein